ncbi:MAG TPA: lipoate--protein ligase family protein, partial [Anaerolineales bacterium]|nr:lipoate--protein ligase family protein [Anaerolineales bacterium]
MTARPFDYPAAKWRLLITQPTDGPLNMAIDEAILPGVAEGASPPTLRFFAWEPPCLSLGCSQPVTDVDMDRVKARGYGLVRRPTGGKAILHTDELTYSVITPQTDPRVAGGIVESYRRLSEGLLRGLALMDLIARNDATYFTAEYAESEEKKQNNSANAALSAAKDNPVCFETPSNYEITVIGKKLIGSAQARKQGVVLQHGSLPLTGDIARICDVLTFGDEAARERAKERVRARAITLELALGQIVPWQTVADAMKHGFREALNLEFESGELSEAE